MNGLAPIIGLCVVCAVICKFFENNNREFAPLVTIAICTAGLAAVVALLSPICDFVAEMMAAAGADGKYTEILFKSAGVSLLTQLGADICRDARETALATVIEAAGKLTLAAMSVTLLAEIAEIVASLTAG